VTQRLKLFGFGSFFHSEIAARDIDILIVHAQLRPDSIQLAIQCKSVIKATIAKAHVVMLSEQEQRDLKFLDRSKAVWLTTVSDVSMPIKIQNLVKEISSYAEKGPKVFHCCSRRERDHRSSWGGVASGALAPRSRPASSMSPSISGQ
jgi:hypothetical protein